jgi:pilus assembly protein CpaB
MNRNARLLASALSVTLLTSVVVYLAAESSGGNANVPTAAKKALVFSKSLPAGYVLTPQDFRWVNASEGSGLVGGLLAREEDKLAAIGGRLSQDVLKGEPVRKTSYVSKPDKPLLSQQLNPGFRALTISADTSQLAAGRLLPGDHVDVLLTPAGGQQGGPIPLPNMSAPTAGATNVTRLYENVRVLAISGATEPEDAAEGKMDSSLLKDATITLELRPDQAERVLAASAIGKIALLLRRPFDPVGQASAPISARARFQLRPASVAPAAAAPSTDPALSNTPAAPQGVIIIRGTN